MAKVYFQTSNPEYKLNEEEDGARLSLFSAIIKQELYDQLRKTCQKKHSRATKKSVESGLFDDINSKWKEIVCKRYKFDCHEKEAKEVEFIEDYELRFWYDKYFKESSSSCRKLSVGIWGGQHQEEEEESSKAHEKKKSKHKAF
ncbi:hypothetical protein F2Q70_00036910 [Brassica cretica]|nr:hypothetical protein F2Q70_00036910 [Brassica cretica]